MNTLSSPHAFNKYWNQSIAYFIIFLINLGPYPPFFVGGGGKDSEGQLVEGGFACESHGDSANAFAEICHCANTVQVLVKF